MRVANLNDRLHVVMGDTLIDLAKASSGQFDPDPQAAFDRWTEVLEWTRSHAKELSAIEGEDYESVFSQLGPVVPRPRQVLAVGLNYQDHVDESDFDRPASPTVFTKFASCLNGPAGKVQLTSDTVDWEVELVVVLGKQGSKVSRGDAWAHVAGLTIGQDISDRETQLRPPAQFSLGKSFAGFGPIGPVLVTPEEIESRNDIRLRCWVNDEIVQSSSTAHMIFDVPDLIAELSSVVTLYPGDLIFTGTPSGVGLGMEPPRYLKSGDVVRTEIEGIGHMRHEFVNAH